MIDHITNLWHNPPTDDTDYITRDEIIFCKMQMKKDKGTIGFYGNMIRKVKGPGIIEGLFYLNNLMYLYSVFPKVWKIADIHPLFKPGKDSRQNAKYYRGISQTQTGGRLYVAILYRKLLLQVQEYISPYQSGGQKRNNTTHQLVRIISDLETYINETAYLTDRRGRAQEHPINHVVVAMLDSSKAYDTMIRPVLFQKFLDMGVDGLLLHALLGFYCERAQRVNVDGIFSSLKYTDTGGPQGSVITLLSWGVYANDLVTVPNAPLPMIKPPHSIPLPQCVASPPDSECIHVDDYLFVYYADSAQDVLRYTQTELNRVQEWLQRNGIKFNASKFHLMDMGKHRLPRSSRDALQFDGITPPWRTTISDAPKALGLFIDCQMSWKSQLRYMLKLFKFKLLWFSYICHYRTGADPRTLDVLFSAYIWSSVSYGCEAWIFQIYDFSLPIYSTDQIKHGCRALFNELQKYYYRSARLILGLKDTSYCIGTLVNIGWLPFAYRLALNALIFYVKIQRNLVNPLLYEHYQTHLHDDELWNSSTFYPHADRLLNNLLVYTTYDVSDLHKFTIPMIKSILKDAMFSECNILWTIDSKGTHTRTLLPSWELQSLPGTTFSRITTSWYYQFRSGHTSLRNGYNFTNTNCRCCDNDIESIEHLFFHCPVLVHDRQVLRNKCSSFNLEFNLRSLLTEPKIRINVERFLNKIIYWS